MACNVIIFGGLALIVVLATIARFKTRNDERTIKEQEAVIDALQKKLMDRG